MGLRIKLSVLFLSTSLYLQLLQFHTVMCDSTDSLSTSTSFNSETCQDLNIQIIANKLPSSFRSRQSSDGSDSKNKQKVYFEQKGQLISQEVGRDSEFAVIMYGPQPIEWMYEGPGQPFSHSSAMEVTDSGCYVIRLVRLPQMGFQTSDTGRYTVKTIGNPERKASVYLYVPNKYPPFLLNTDRLQSVDLQEGKPLVLPCLLNDPNVRVSLSKRVGLNEWQEVKKGGTFHPQTGFTLRKPVNGATSLYGSYKCYTSLHNRNDTVFMYVSPTGY